MSAYGGSSKNLTDLKDLRKHGLSTEQFPVSAYIGSSKNIKDLNDVIRKEAWLFYRTSSGGRLCWELEGPQGPKGGCVIAPNKLKEAWVGRRIPDC